MGHCLFRTNKQKIPIRRSVERLGVFNCVFLETGLDMEEVRTVKKVMERLQDMYSCKLADYSLRNTTNFCNFFRK